jgi:hypothetical protein
MTKQAAGEALGWRVVVQVQHLVHLGDEVQVGGGFPGLGGQPADARVMQQ